MISEAVSKPANEVRVFLLGAFRIELDSQSLRLPRRKVESLLAYLVLHPQAHPREKLAALFWGDSSDAQARHSLRTALDVLRKIFGDQFLLADRDTIRRNPAYPVWVDALEFERTAQSEESALELYQGDLLSNFYDAWVLPEREHYRNLYIDTLLRITQHWRAQSEYERAAEFAQKTLTVDTANERAFQHLMFCRLMTGKRDAALKEYEQCVRALQVELGVEPAAETTALHHWIKQSTESKSLESRITNLPIPVSSFIGRKREMAEIKRLLASTRLLTLAGAGGSGKTRLAIQVASDLVDSFPQGVWWIELASISEVSLVPQAIAKTLGVREAQDESLIETLGNFVRIKRLLLVLDNCEHLISACAQIAATLLSVAPDLKILTTSREALGITGELIYQVPTLASPRPQQISLVDLLMEYESVRLFVERAKGVVPEFLLTEQNALAVAQVCQRLDGIPLAIELAAARTRVLSIEHIAERLNDRFDLLTTGSRTALPRQQTLRATMDWSYDLLRDEGRTLFPRLSIFEGGFTLDAVEKICCAPPLAPSKGLDVLARLVDRSLVIVEFYQGELRYRLLETMRQYGNEKLSESEELKGLKDRHLNYFLQFAEQARSNLEGRDATIWLDRLELEHGNIRLALEWGLAKEEHWQRTLRLAAAMGSFWFNRGYFSEGRAWLRQSLEAATRAIGQIENDTQSKEPAQFDQEQYKTSRAWALEGAGNLARGQGDFASSRKLFQESVDLFRGTNDRMGLATALHGLGMVTLNVDPPYARSLLEESMSIAGQIGYMYGVLRARLWLGHFARNEGDEETARRLYEENITWHRENASPSGVIAWPLYQLGCLTSGAGDYAGATLLLEESITKFRDVGDKRGLAEALAALGDAKRWIGDNATARNVYQEALALNRQLNIKWANVWCLHGLGQLALYDGDLAHARKIFCEGLTIKFDIARLPYTVMCVEDMAVLSAMERTVESAIRSARLFGATTGRLKEILTLMNTDHIKATDYKVDVRAMLGDNQFEKEFEIGQAIPLEQIVEYALQS